MLMIALALMSLSRVTRETDTHNEAWQQARANARLALARALGELQKHAGADTRITASSLLTDASNPPALGVWRSWEGENHDYQGKPIAPDYSNHKNARFLSWLVSSAEDDSELGDVSSLVYMTPQSDTVPLLAQGSLGNADTRQVHVVPKLITKELSASNEVTSGAIAWWVSGENQKARLTKPYEPDNNNVAGWAALTKSHGVADPVAFGLDPADNTKSIFSDPEQVAKALTLHTAELIPAAEDLANAPINSFHDLSVHWRVCFFLSHMTR